MKRKGAAIVRRSRTEPHAAPEGHCLDRRTWLATAALLCLGGRARAQDPPRPDESTAVRDRERQAVEAIAAKAGLRRIQTDVSANYLAIGDARDDFRALTLRDCEGVRADYLDHYRAKGFRIVEPEQRLTVITLADDRSFAAFMEKQEYVMTPRKESEPTVDGLYQRGTNRLIVFDHRSLGPQLAPRAGLTNLRTLAHEATHQLTFNTGLLNRDGDVPACITEGLASYGEVRRTKGRTPPGAINQQQLQNLATTQRRGFGWIGVEKLITDDLLVRGFGRGHQPLLAYAQSWLLVHYLMNTTDYIEPFRDYLKAIRARENAESRLDDARAHLGDLERLDLELRVYAVRLQKSS